MYFGSKKESVYISLGKVHDECHFRFNHKIIGNRTYEVLKSQLLQKVLIPIFCFEEELSESF